MRPPQLHSRVPPVLLVKAEPARPSVVPPPFRQPTEQEKLIKYGLIGGAALLGLLLFVSLLSGLGGDAASDNSGSNDSGYSSDNGGGSYEDRMNAGIAELGGTYDSTTGTMSTNR